MDTSKFASHPGDSTWEEPRFNSLHTIRPFSPDNAGSRDGHDLSDRAKALDRISLEFQTLVAKNSPLSDVESFVRNWEISSSTDTPVVQPNVLAWFSDTNALRLACENNNKEVVRFLLERGLSIHPSAVLFAASKMRETKDTTIVELLLTSGWDINKPLRETTPPLIR